MGVSYMTMPTHRTASAQANHWSLRATRSAPLAMAPAAMKWTTDADEDRHHGPVLLDAPQAARWTCGEGSRLANLLVTPAGRVSGRNTCRVPVEREWGGCGVTSPVPRSQR
jgi:hypothetical protein